MKGLKIFLSGLTFYGLLTLSYYADDKVDAKQERLKTLIKEYLTAEAKENVLRTLNEEFKELPSRKVLAPIIKSAFVYPEVKRNITYNYPITIQKEKLEYYIYVPEGYEPNKIWPVIFCLHGTGDSGNKFIKLWRDDSPHQNKYLIVAPSFQSGLWWEGAGEELVLAVLADIKKKYAVDTNRIYITGFSNGGIGAWYFGLAYPERFAAIVPAAGQCLPDCLPSLLNLPVYIMHGAKDPVISVKYDRTASEELKKLGYDYVYKEFPDMEHRYPQDENPKILKWFETRQRIVSPKKVVFLADSNNIERGQAYWLKITGIKDKTRLPVKITAEIKGGNRIEISTEGVMAFDIYLNDEMVNFAKPVQVWVNGKKVYDEKIKPQWNVLLQQIISSYDPERIYTAEIKIKG